MVCRTTQRLPVWTPWQNVAQLSHNLGVSGLDGLLGAVFGEQSQGAGPAFNVAQKEHAYVLTAEIPGLNVEELEISVLGQALTVSGQRIATPVPENARVQRQERTTGAFSRTFKFPVRLDAQHTTANYERGVLTIQTTTATADRPVKVQVQTATAKS